MDLHPGERIIFEGRPSWRSILGFYVIGVLGAAVAGVIAKLAADDTGVGILIFSLVLLGVLVAGFVKRIETRYTITSERLHIRRGLLARSVQQTKLERVQNVNTEQSVFERILRIGTVDFDTAGTDDSDFTFAGVADPEDVVRAVDDAQRADAAPGPGPGPHQL